MTVNLNKEERVEYQPLFRLECGSYREIAISIRPLTHREVQSDS